MKYFFQITFKICLILAVSIGCEAAEEIIETDPVAILIQGASFVKKGEEHRRDN